MEFLLEIPKKGKESMRIAFEFAALEEERLKLFVRALVVSVRSNNNNQTCCSFPVGFSPLCWWSLVP